MQGGARSGSTPAAAVVNVALPSIRGDLVGGITGLQRVVDGSTLMFAALLLTAGAPSRPDGRLAERLGARALVTGGLALMTAGLVILDVVPSSTPSGRWPC